MPSLLLGSFGNHNRLNEKFKPIWFAVIAGLLVLLEGGVMPSCPSPSSPSRSSSTTRPVGKVWIVLKWRPPPPRFSSFTFQVNEIYRDLANIVDQQQEAVEQIETNTEGAHARAQEGLVQVRACVLGQLV